MIYHRIMSMLMSKSIQIDWHIVVFFLCTCQRSEKMRMHSYKVRLTFIHFSCLANTNAITSRYKEIKWQFYIYLSTLFYPLKILYLEISSKIDSKDYLICGAGRAIGEGTCVKICDFQENKCLHGTCFSHTNGTANCV